MLKIYPYKIGSESARNLARGLHVKRIIPGGRYRPGHHTTVVNWGSSQPIPNERARKWYNKPSAVANASNKLTALRMMQAAGVSVPAFTTSAQEANAWLMDDFRVVVRSLLNAHSGRGISILKRGDNVPYAPLYTRYAKKVQEYRVHVINGRVVDIAQKRRRGGEAYDEANDYVRNHATGWVFCRDGVSPPQCVIDESIKAVRALGLDFGAVDVGYRPDKAIVYEVNCAPGLTGTTLETYIREFSRL